MEYAYAGYLSESPDEAADTDSQPFISSCATRAVIFIESPNKNLGLITMVAIGMGEVSSSEITVKADETVKKGQELGMFHFGGSTHCLVFRPGVKLNFLVPLENGSKNVAVKASLAELS